MKTIDLERWYIKHHRKLPFRETKNPYHIWVSEIMLQQTQVDTVIPYFNHFIQRFPTIIDLADSQLEDILKAVEGIGYYRRFRLMHNAAQVIKDQYQGIFPSDYEAVIALPGVGKYTAGAIMSIAYDKPYAATDGNVIRVLSRVYGIEEDMRLEKHKKKIDQLNQSLIENSRPEIYTQAVMELGALICKPTQPRCVDCPIHESCAAYQTQKQEVLPVLSKLKEKKQYHFMTLIITDGHQTCYVRKRTESLLHGMYLYPQYDKESIHAVISDLSDQGIELEPIGFIGRYRHVFTHQTWDMDVYHVRLLSGQDPSWIAVTLDQMDQLPMAVAHKKIRREATL